MICRQAGSELLLITQTDHAGVSERLAEAWGNQDFAPPRPREQVIAAVAHHDDGWEEADGRPALGPRGTPLDFMHVPPRLAVRIWDQSIRLAASFGPLSGLIVSVHFTELARWGASHHWDRISRESRQVADFFQRQADNQQRWRAELDPESRRFEPYDLAVMRACDWASLLVCCNQPPPAAATAPTFPEDEHPTELSPRRTACGWELSPWPFCCEQLAFSVEATVIPNRAYPNETELHAAMWEAPTRELPVVLRPPADSPAGG